MDFRDLENENFQGFYDVKNQLIREVYNRSADSFSLGRKMKDSLMSPEDLKMHNAFMREKLIRALGGLPENTGALNDRITGIVQCEGCRIEKVVFEARPKVYVTANVYVPDAVSSSRGAVLFLCGHHDSAKHAEVYQKVCRYIAKTGLIVMAADPTGQGERSDYYERSIGSPTIRCGSTEHDYVGNQCWFLGKGLARYFIHDAMRAIDYLCSRKDVDPGRIGVTGSSGGGMQTGLMMVCDPRIAAAAPAAFITSRESYMLAGGAQDCEQIWPGMTALGFDHEDILISMAPRPVLVLAAKSDYFPVEGTRNTVKRAERFWEMYGDGSAISLFEEDSVHMYSDRMAKAAADFFASHFSEFGGTVNNFDTAPIEASMLRCTASGQVMGEFDDAITIYDENLSVLLDIEAQRKTAGKEEYRERALQWLHEKVFSRRNPCDLNPRFYSKWQVEELSVQGTFWWSRKGIINYSMLFKNCRLVSDKLPVTIAVWDGGTNCIQKHLKWIRDTCNSKRAVLVLDTSGVGKLSPNPLNGYEPQENYGTVYKLANDLMWLGDSIVALRIYDVIRALDMIGAWPGIDENDIRFYACGSQGIYARLAAVLDKRAGEVDVRDGLDSFAGLVRARYYDSYGIANIILPGVLEYFDIPDLEEWSGST